MGHCWQQKISIPLSRIPTNSDWKTVEYLLNGIDISHCVREQQEGSLILDSSDVTIGRRNKCFIFSTRNYDLKSTLETVNWKNGITRQFNFWSILNQSVPDLGEAIFRIILLPLCICEVVLNTIVHPQQQQALNAQLP